LIEPVSGKRFLTFASKEKQVVLLNASYDIAPTTFNMLPWRGVHVTSSKESFTLKGTNLPVLKIQVHLELPYIKLKKFYAGHFEIGVAEKGNLASSYTLIQKFQENTEGWKEQELDLSGLPKDKEFVLVLRYFACDSRYGASPGVQIDDIKIFDDGL